MKFKLIVVAVCLGYLTPAVGQVKGTVDVFNEDFWEEKPTLTILTEEEQKSNAVYLADVNVCTYEYGTFLDPGSGRLIDNVLMEENLHYKRIRLNNDQAVEMFNKVYISMANARKVTNLKARAISKSGKVIEFDDKNKKEVENYENYGPFTIFALEGIEVGSEIEYTYTTKEPSMLRNIYFAINAQGPYPKRNFHYELNSPDDFIFKTKSYNGLADMVEDTSTVKDNKRYVLHLDKVDKFKKEDYSLESALRKRVEIKLFEVTSYDKRNFFSFSKATTEYADMIYNGENQKELKKESKAVKGLIKEQEWDKLSDQKDQIIAIEHYIKSEFENGNTGKFYVHESIEQKVFSNQNAIRIYAKIFDQLNIDHQVVLTCNRFDKSFDADFETYSFLETYLFYFPKFDQFMSPINSYMRFGLVSSAYAYSKGLFLKPVKAGSVRSFFPEVKDIPGTNSDVNFDNMILDVQFEEDFEKVKAHLKHEASGYSSAYLRPIMAYVSEEKKIEILEDRLKSFAEDAEVSNVTSSNEEMEGYMLGKPYVFEGDAESSVLIEKAGNKYLFKMGLVIGAQVEMYQDTARMFDVENTYNHGYLRVLNIKIPDGYKITNLDDLNMDVSSSKDGKKTMEFTSKYELRGDLLVVTCNEYYDEISVPLNRYEEFRSVINAAADFNKITLVFEKE